MHSKFILKELSRYNIGTYADIIYRNALLYPAEEAFVYRNQRITFAQYNQRVNNLICALTELGAKKGDVLGILSWNCLDYIDIFGAAMKGGFIASPFNPRLKEDELANLINYSEATTLFAGSELIEAADRLKRQLPRVKRYIALEAAPAGSRP